MNYAIFARSKFTGIMASSSKEEQAYRFDSSHFIVYLWRWRKPLLLITLGAAILAAIFSGPTFIEPKYQSSVTVFPSTTNSLSKALLPQKFSSRGQDILEFGSEEQAEQLLQILHSDRIRSTIIERYDLMSHYDIDSSQRYARTQLYDTYEENISFRRTEFMSVEITVLDTDPDTAAMIANDIVVLLDEAKNEIQRERAEKGLNIIRNEYQSLKGEINSLEDSITQLRRKGIHSYEDQSSVFSEQLATAIIEQGVSSPAVRNIQDRLDTLAKYGSAYISLRERLSSMQEELAEIRSTYDQAKVDVEQDIPATFRVNEAYPAEKKSYPIRWLIVALSGLGAFVIGMITILVYDTIRQSSRSEIS